MTAVLMKRYARFLVAATTVLASCSWSSDGTKTPEELVMFILTGLEKDTDVKSHDGTVFNISAAGEHPLSMHLTSVGLDSRYQEADFTTHDQGNCVFAFRMVSGPLSEIFEVRADFASYKNASYVDAKTIRLDGVTMQCLSAGYPSCEARQAELGRGLWNSRSLPLEMSDAAERDKAIADIDSAAKALISNSSCKRS